MKITKYKIIEYEEEIPETLNGFRNWEFSTGGTTGADFKVFAKLFRKFIKENLPPGAVLKKFNVNHYYVSGFIERNNKYVYFSISDVRYFKNAWAENILIRTAKNEEDYTGGSNRFTDLKFFKSDVISLLEA